MANPEHLKILKQGVDVWNKWRRKNRWLEPDLSSAELSKVNLYRADFIRANLNQVNFSGSSLQGVLFIQAELKCAKLNGSYLNMADFSQTEMDYTDFSNATIGWTNFGNCDLRKVKGLDSVIHTGPSNIGIFSIMRSGGNIPEKFLTEVGIPKDIIAYFSSIGAERSAIKYYSCFISYSSKDQEFADRICVDLQNNGVQCWFAPKDIRGGKKIDRQLDEAIRHHDKLLLVLSDHSLASDWVATEIRWARKREKESGKRKLFPIALVDYEKLKLWELFDSDTVTNLAAEVRSYYIPDFTRWDDPDFYQNTFERLLEDLKARDGK
jgi:uncharacterized protein YjbI with pentapeptide repeats